MEGPRKPRTGFSLRRLPLRQKIGALDAGSYSSDLQADTGDSGQNLLAGCTVLPLRDGDRAVFDALTAR